MEIEKLMRHHSATKKRIKFGSVSYTHLTLPTTSRRQRQMCIRDRNSDKQCFSLIIFVDCRAFGQLPFLFIETGRFGLSSSFP